jgi:aspartyl-tRNA(Asn)/glutamyl-tRNA(Gln) amidotransferase subunit A
VSSLPFLTLDEASRAIQRREVTSLQLVEACLARIEEFKDALNCFVTVTADEAIQRAELADSEIASGKYRGPLHGIPLAEKDMFFTPGKASSMGSALGQKFVPTTRATILDRMETAGAVSVGTLHMSEFAAGPTGQNEYLGSCKNPWNVDYISGGSSSGSACAVAARFVYGSMGSDTGGSIRLPAAMCGVVGLKPTHGVVSRHGAMPRCWSLDIVGPIARTAIDCAVLLQAVAGRDEADPATFAEQGDVSPELVSRTKRPPLVGFPSSVFGVTAESEVGRNLKAASDVLVSLGCELVDIELPSTNEIYALTQIVNKAEAAAIHARWLLTSPEKYGLSARSRIEAGFHIPAPIYLAALAARPRVLKEFGERVFSKVDVVLLPVIPRDVPTISEVGMKTSADVPHIVDEITKCTRWVSYLGLPAIAVPCGFSRGGLPISFQLLGKPYSEASLLALVHHYQTATGWHERVPDIGRPVQESSTPQVKG